jgi:Tol biopolymer transport system component
MINQNELIQHRYRLIRLLGSGGFGAVYLAEDQRLGRTVAIKEIDVARLGPDERAAAEQLFEHEARILASLDHPGLTRIWDFFQQERRAFLVMEYVPGCTLRDTLHRRGGPLDEPFVLECALQLCGVLGYLHTRRPQVIFRDLKPANVMVVEPSPAIAGEPPEPPVFRLIDFGIARLFKPDQTGDTLIIGTPGYAPPEQHGQGQTDERSDIYGLGATLYHLLSDRVPNTVPPPPLASVNPAVSPELARIVARATAVDPAERYQRVEDLRRDLLAVARAQPLAAHDQALGKAAVRAPWQPPTVAAHRTPTQLPLPPGLTRPIRRSSSAVLIVVVLAVLGILGMGGVLICAFSRRPAATNRPSATPASQPTVAPASQDWLLPGAPGRIVFGQYSGGVAYNLMLATLDGRPPQALTDTGADFSGAPAPDGSKIAFARVVVKDKRAAILIGDLTARRFQQAVAPDGYARYPAWSPDGRQLAYATAPDRFGNFRLAILDLATGQTRFPGPDHVGWVTWSRQGLTYAARLGSEQAQDLFILDAHDVPRNLTNTSDVEEEFPSWSPAVARLAFVGSPAGAENLPQRQIFVIGADGGDRIQLTSGAGAHSNPVWSPDGKWIAYLYQQPGSTLWQVWAMRADGSAPRQITSDAADKFYLAWGR